VRVFVTWFSSSREAVGGRGERPVLIRRRSQISGGAAGECISSFLTISETSHFVLFCPVVLRPQGYLAILPISRRPNKLLILNVFYPGGRFSSFPLYRDRNVNMKHSVWAFHRWPPINPLGPSCQSYVRKGFAVRSNLLDQTATGATAQLSGQSRLARATPWVCSGPHEERLPHPHSTRARRSTCWLNR
jgi:hypothetical protein